MTIFSEPVVSSHLDYPVNSVRLGLLVLRALYAADRPGVLAVENADPEGIIFAVWSQQWPRLRRSFSFRTARLAGEQAFMRTRFDLRLTRASSPAGAPRGQDHPIEQWERVALDDLLHGLTDFRRFLWRYGSDQPRDRERFRFLTELYAATRTPRLADGALARVLEQVVEVLHGPSDGRLLNEDLVSAGATTRSYLRAILSTFLTSLPVEPIGGSRPASSCYVRSCS